MHVRRDISYRIHRAVFDAALRLKRTVQKKQNNHTSVLIYFGVVIFISLFALLISAGFSLLFPAPYITFLSAIGVNIVVAITTITIGGNIAASISPIA